MGGGKLTVKVRYACMMSEVLVIYILLYIVAYTCIGICVYNSVWMCAYSMCVLCILC